MPSDNTSFYSLMAKYFVDSHRLSIGHQVVLVILLMMSITAWAGDDASGSTSFQLDLSTPHHTYSLTDSDKKWTQSLIHNLHYKGKIVYFVKTDIKIMIDHEERTGEIYKALEKSGVYYVVAADAMLKIGTSNPYSPGVNGFSMHLPKSKKFIVCLNFQTKGVPINSSTPIIKGEISWNGHLWSRF